MCIDSKMIIFYDNNNKSKLVYLPLHLKADSPCLQFGRTLREMLMGPMSESVTSQGDLKARLDPRVRNWPKDAIEKTHSSTVSCLKEAFTMDKGTEVKQWWRSSRLCHGIQVMTSVLQGTFGYMDPYTIETGQVGFHSYTYALGCIILQLLTGIEHIQAVQELLKELETILHINRFAAPASRWGDDPDALNEVIEHLCLKLDPRSSEMPKKTLKKTMGLLLGCLERRWEYRLDLNVLLSSLEELENLASKERESERERDLEKPGISAHRHPNLFQRVEPVCVAQSGSKGKRKYELRDFFRASLPNWGQNRDMVVK